MSNESTVNRVSFISTELGYVNGVGKTIDDSRSEKKNYLDSDIDSQPASDSMSDIPVVNRAQWGSRWEFVLSCLGYTVGLGNVVRFPYLAVQQGGGAFLIPYVICLFLAGIPLLVIEFAIGQYAGMSVAHTYNVVPIFKGIGWCMIAMEILLCVYYNALISWVLYYFGMSFSWPLPWSSCGNWWNTEGCFTFATVQGNDSMSNTTVTDRTMNSTLANITRRSAAEEFWFYNALEISDGIENLNGINWKMAVCLTAAWISCYFCLCKGVKSIGKVVYVTAIAPYVLITVMLIRGVTLPGSWIGIKYYIVPDFSKLYNIQIWSAAGMQIFYSLGPAWGGLLTMASYSRFDYNFLRASVYLPIMCACTSIYAGFAVFGVIGHMLYKSGAGNFDAFVRQGPGLIFVAYPEALATLPGAPIWSVLFFLMIFSIGLDTQFVSVEVITAALFDYFPITLGKHKSKVIGVICACLLLLGLILTTRAGFYIYQLIDWYGSPFSVLVISLLEFIAISYVLGAPRLLRFVEDMLGPLQKWTKYILLTLLMVTGPCFATAVVIFSCLDYSPPQTHNNNSFPDWAIGMGWGVAAFSLIQLPLVGIYMIYKYRKTPMQLFRPTPGYLQRAALRKLVREKEKQIASSQS